MDYKEHVKFYFLNIDFGENRTGIENSSLSRARLFKNYLGISPILVTTAYNPRLGIQRNKLYENGLLDKSSLIINLYAHFQETKSNYQELQNRTLNANNKWTYKPVPDTKDYRIYDEDNKLIMYRKCDNDGLLIYNNIFTNQKKVRRDTYDAYGSLSRTQYLYPETGQVYSEVYYRTDGTVCIYKHFELNGDKSKLSCIHISNKEGEIIESFKSETELITYWIQQLLEVKVHNFLIIDKERVYYPALLNINQSNVSIVCMIHSTYLQKDQDIIKGKLNSNYSKIFKDLTKPDAVVFLTNRQKEHIEKRFGLHDNLYVIPHSIEGKIRKVDFEKRLPLRAIYLARYSEEKQHDSLIRVFYKVVQKHPAAKLDLYGYGGQKETMIKQINDLGLENNITVNNFVVNVEEIYNTASLAILSSRVEGFSLFLLESIAYGCPVVSYDIDYGPSDMIDQGINGYLVEKNNEEEMAKIIIDLFNNKEKLKAMSEASYSKAESFQSKLIAEKWSALIEKVIHRKCINELM